MGNIPFRTSRYRIIALCALILLGGLVHQALMSSSWHRSVMAVAEHTAEMAPGAPDGDTAAPSTRDGGGTPTPAPGNCPVAQSLLPALPALLCPEALAVGPRAAPPSAVAGPQPLALAPSLPPGRRRALLQIYII